MLIETDVDPVWIEQSLWTLIMDPYGGYSAGQDGQWRTKLFPA
jgi:hypothetical protein